MKFVTEQDEKLRQYLLDEISDDERQFIEEKFLTDDSYFDNLQAVEDELYFDYKQGSLSPKEKITFENKFLSTAEDLQKAEFTETFLQVIEENREDKSAPAFWQSIAAFFSFSNSFLRLGTTAVSLLILFLVGFWILSDPKISPELVSVPEEIKTPTPSQTPVVNSNLVDKQKEQEDLEKTLAEEKQKQEQNANKIRELEKEKEKIQQENEANKAKKTEHPPQKTFIALILSPVGINRGSGMKTAKINLTPEIKNVNLSLSIKKDFQDDDFKIVVRNIDTGASISSKEAKSGKKTSVSLTISAQKLARGAYEAVLINEDGEELNSYYFNVEKK